MLAATRGAARYRLEFAGRGHQRGAIRQVIERAYELCPEILNDARQAPWSIDVIPSGHGMASVELRPRLYPDPRLWYRQDDIAAASHPPLAACMARLAGLEENEAIWDPFCGSGLELIECGLRGGVSAAHGTDLNSKALEVARANFAAAHLEPTQAKFTCCDFREAGQSAGIAPGSISLVITNPPLGRRVRIKDMQGLFADLYTQAARALRIGGRLLFVNPLRTGPNDPSLHLEYQKTIDLGGFNCRLELYRKILPGKQTPSSKKVSNSTRDESTPRRKKPDPAWWSRVGRTRRS
jgi:predicted RNA methylase